MTAPARLFVLLVWTPALGAALTPIGALAVADDTADGALDCAVSFIPRLDGRDEPWRIRLDEPVTARLLQRWTEESSACALARLEVPDGSVDLAGAAEAGVDVLLAEWWPALTDAGAR
jgi:hypothetical protein